MLVGGDNPRKPAAAMENPVSAYDAATWIGRISIHQDFFWFFSLLLWSLAMIVWWRHPRSREAWAWLPGAGGAAIAMALIQFGMFNPTFDFFQDRLIPGTVSNYRPALIDPNWLGDVLTSAVLAAMIAAWGWLAARRSGRAHLRWWPAVLLAGVTLFHTVYPLRGGAMLAILAVLAGGALWSQVRALAAARWALATAALLPVFSTIGPLAAATQTVQRFGPPTPMGLGAALFQLLLGGLVLRSLLRGGWLRLPAEAQPALRRDRRIFGAIAALLLVAGIVFGIQTGRDNRLEIQQNRLRTAAAHAAVFDPALLAPLANPAFHPDLKSVTDLPAPVRSAYLAGDKLEAARWRLAEVVIATPFVDRARLVVLKDGWLVAVLSSDRRAVPGTVEILRRATPADHARWEKKEPYVESSPVHEIGYAYYCRAPIVAADGRMLAWLDCVRREYYLSVERRWRAAPFVGTALGIVLLSLMVVQRQGARERESALRRAAVAAEGSRIKTVFLANVSHELRTPLQSILGYGELLTTDSSPENRRVHLAALRQQGELMLRLVNDLIDLSAVEAGSFQFAERPCDPADFMRQTVESLRPRAATKGLFLHLELAADLPPWVAVDDGRLRQVLLNLTGNAIKFTDAGSVTVGLHAAPVAEGWQLVLTVRDTGPGIPSAEQARLFTALSRLEQTAAKEGSGLGLALSAALCRAMGGDITVASDGRTGSCFTATVLVATAAAPAPDHRPGPIAPGAAPRVLVVDDNHLVRELFVSSLAAHGSRCRSAGTGADALARVDEDKPEVIVLDLALPDGDGAALVPELRRRAPGVRIIGASAHAGAADRARALAAGMDAFLVKPVALDQLWTAVLGAAPAAAAPPAFFDPPEELRVHLEREFFGELPARRAELTAAMEAADWPRVRAAAHYLRNSALVVQAAALFDACTGLEEAATTGQPGSAQPWWDRCRQAFDRLETSARTGVKA